MAFNLAEADIMPSLACVGVIESIGEISEPPEDKKYGVGKIKIVGTEGVSRTAYTNVLVRPEWFTPGFDPRTLAHVAGQDYTEEENIALRRSLQFVYRRLFGTKDQPGQLAVMSGSPEGFNKLADAFASATAAKNRELTYSEVGEILAQNLVGNEVGYILKQARDKVPGVVDEKGKQVYSLREQYEVSEWFYPTETQKKRVENRAEKNNQKTGATPLLVCWES